MNRTIAVLFLTLSVIAAGCQSTPPSVVGTWKFIPARSTDMATWRSRLPQLTIDTTATAVRVQMAWMERSRAATVDTFLFTPSGDPARIPVRSRLWPANWYMGVLAVEGSMRTVTGEWTEPPLAFRMTNEQPVEISQGEALLRTRWEVALDPGTGILTVREERSSRPTPVVMVFERLEQ